MAAAGAFRFRPRALVPCLGLCLWSPCGAGSAPSGPGACSPSQPESPINIDPYRVGKTGAESFLPKLSWKPAAGLQLTNAGTHLGVQSNQLGYVTLIGNNGFPKYYEISSVALKMPSEHLVAGKQFPAELQIVHKSQLSVLELDDRDVLITSFMFDLGEESKLLSLLLPQPLPVAGASATIKRPVDLMWGMGPALDGSFFKYNGSYVAQSCGERVQWIVFERPMTLSSSQQQAFQAAVPTQAAASVQTLGMRSIAKDTTEEGKLGDYRFFVGRDTAYNAERTNPFKIFAPVVGTVALCIAVMCSIFVREDAHRKQSSAGGLSVYKADKMADAC